MRGLLLHARTGYRCTSTFSLRALQYSTLDESERVLLLSQFSPLSYKFDIRNSSIPDFTGGQKRRRMVVGVPLWICSLSVKREHQHVINIHSRWVWHLNYFLVNICVRMLVGCQDDPQYRQHTIEREEDCEHTQSLTLVSTSVHSSSSSWSS